ncbi:PA3496 family putative envelope integrity protein [Vibrio maritimus]|uniref:PA3496 family putative envelope integrity protein n=1 Tax=Vibrio maritimus TaxID=990268 RepID=UPI001F264AAB|nr:hypothetical protein [Vibrio maritimus]
MAERNNSGLLEKQPWTIRTQARKEVPKKPNENQKQHARVRRRIEQILEERELRKLWTLD